MAQIDEAMKTATLDEATKAKVMELYAKGKASTNPATTAPPRQASAKR